MAHNIIIITNDEQVKSAEYADYRDIQKAVGGTFDIYASRCLSDIYAHRCLFDLYAYRCLNFRRADEKKVCSLQLLFYCNDEGLLIDSEEMNKANAAAYMLNSEAVVYGNIAILIDAGEGESRGFTPEETEKIVSVMKKFLNDNRRNCKMIHAKLDGNKPELIVGFFAKRKAERELIMKSNSMTLQEAIEVITKTIHIGSEIGGYVVFGVWNNCCIAENPKAPEPYVVWTIDSDGFGVRAGKYFENFQQAQKCFYQEAIKSRPRAGM